MTVPPPRPAMRSNAPVRPGQLPERLAISGPRPREQIGCHHLALLPFRTTPASARYIHRPRRELCGSRAPSFPVTRCMHYRPPGRSERRIVPRQLETTLEVDDGIVRIGRAQEAGAQDARSCARPLADGPAGACHRSSGGDRGQLLLTMDPKNWIEDKGYIGNNIITPFRKPAGGELLDWQKEYNTQVNKIR